MTLSRVCCCWPGGSEDTGQRLCHRAAAPAVPPGVESLAPPEPPLPRAFLGHLCRHGGGFPPPQAAHRQTHLQRRILTILLPKSYQFPPRHPNSAGWRALLFSLLSHSSFQQALPCLPRGCSIAAGSFALPMPLKPAGNAPPALHSRAGEALVQPWAPGTPRSRISGLFRLPQHSPCSPCSILKHLKHLYRIHGRSAMFFGA